MKTFSQLVESINEAWPGTKEYEAKYGKAKGMTGGKTEFRGNRHDVTVKDGVTKAIRRTDSTGDTAEPDKKVEIKDGPKRGRGRPPGKYGSYKKKVKESIDIIESLETEEEIAEFIDSLDEESYNELVEFLDNLDEEQLDEMQYGKEYKQDHIMKKIKSGDWEAVTDVKPGKLVDLRHYTGKTVTVRVKEDLDAMSQENFDQLDELSKATLGSYVKKAANSIHNNSFRSGEKLAKGDTEGMSKDFMKSHKRQMGTIRAAQRLTRENLELDEAKNPDAIKSVGSSASQKGAVIVITNSGAKYTITAKQTGGVMPKPGELISKYVKEDVDQLDELSKSTLGSYMAQATGKAMVHSRAAQDSNNADDIQKHSKIAQKKLSGAAKAHNKMVAKEDVDLEQHPVKISESLSVESLAAFITKSKG